MGIFLIYKIILEDYRVKELQEKIKMLENGENGNLNRFFKAGISKVKYEMKPHFKAYFHESIKQPMVLKYLFLILIFIYAISNLLFHKKCSKMVEGR